MNNKKWKLSSPCPLGFSESLGMKPLHAQLLHNRGLRTRSNIDAFIRVDDTLRHDPELLPDMERSVAKLSDALLRSQRIGIFGDFDTDGISGTALLYLALIELGYSVSTYLPDRVSEGHGLSERGIRFFKEQKVSVMITVDCGGNSVDEILLASSLGIETIVTDHHVMNESNTAAYSVISHMRDDSDYPYPYLTGSGTAFKLVEALFAQMNRPKPDHLLGLAALGTLSDIGPLIGENRYIVKRGLDQLNHSPSVGIKALMAVSGIERGKLDTEALNFKLIPRLNAAGRLDKADLSFDLLTEMDPDVAASLADNLDVKNKERRKITEICMDEARNQVQDHSRFGTDLESLLFVASETWPPGILGLIAGRLVDEFGRPAVAVNLGQSISKGSARSIEQFDISAALEREQDLLIRFGGHHQAAGFTLLTENLSSLKRRMGHHAKQYLENIELVSSINIDFMAPPESVTDPATLSFIGSLEPFGKFNPQPLFWGRGLEVIRSSSVGRDRSHLKFLVSSGGKMWDSIAFGRGEMELNNHRSLDMVYSINRNDWGGQSRIQLNVVDLHPN